MTAFYGTAEDLRLRTGVRAEDLGIADDPTLETFLENLLTEVSDLVNRRIGRDYLAEFDAGTISAIPPGLTGIVVDVAADSLRTMIATRQTPVVRIDDFAVRVIRSTTFSPDVRDRLRLYGNRGIGAVTLTSIDADEVVDLPIA